MHIMNSLKVNVVKAGFFLLQFFLTYFGALLWHKMPCDTFLHSKQFLLYLCIEKKHIISEYACSQKLTKKTKKLQINAHYEHSKS